MAWKPTISDLPRELYGVITSQSDIEDLAVMSQINTRFQRETKEDYLERLCREDLHLSEIRDYLMTKPSRFGYMHFHPLKNLDIKNAPTSTYIIEANSNLFHPRQDHYSRNIGFSTYRISIIPGSHVLTYDEYQFAGINDHGPLVDFIVIPSLSNSLNDLRDERHRSITSWPYPQMDLYSLYEILKRRLGCVSRDASYPKKRTHEVLDYTYNQYRSFLQEESWERILNTFIMHNYVKMNADTLGIPFGKLFDDDSDYVVMSDGSLFKGTEETEGEFNEVLRRMQKEIDETVPLLHEAIEEFELNGRRVKLFIV